MGILQITGFTNNPRGVKIRYKLVQNTSSEKTGQTSFDSLGEARTQLAETETKYGANSSQASAQRRLVDELASAAGGREGRAAGLYWQPQTD
jgi:hypothetical protein